MKRIAFSVFFVSLLVALIAFLRTQGENEAEVDLSSEETRIEYSVYAGTTKSFSIILKNSTSTSIPIEGFTTSCSCTGVTPQKITLAPHSHAEIQVVVLPPKKGASQFGVVIQPISNEFAIAPLTLSIAIKEPLLTFNPSNIGFSTAVGPGELRTGRDIELSVANAVTDIYAKLDESLGRAEVDWAPGNHRGVLGIRFRSDLQPGKIQNQLVVTATQKNREAFQVSIPIEFEVHSGVRVFPELFN
jgi:hypothetical protein